MSGARSLPDGPGGSGQDRTGLIRTPRRRRGLPVLVRRNRPSDARFAPAPAERAADAADGGPRQAPSAIGSVGLRGNPRKLLGMPSDEMSPRRSGDAAKMRAADSDREAVAERLRDAAAEGRLSMDELEERLDAAFSAKTFADLEPIVDDLPEAASAPRRTDEPLVLKAGGSNLRQTGYWVAPSEIVASAGMGNIKLDFTEAECPHKVMTVKVSAGMGNVVVVVPRGWEVQTQEM